MLLLCCVSCTATSRIDGAVITEVNGAPCFSIPENAETRNGVPLFTLAVNKRNAPGATTPPEDVWFVRVVPLGQSILWKPKNCIRYGVVPKGAEQDFLIPLQPYDIYTLTLQAVPEGSNLRGYDGEFCLIPDDNKKLRVKTVPWDEKNSTWRYEVCSRPVR
jgi:hypothetical protein